MRSTGAPEQTTVLVVDDDHKFISLVRMYLEREGFRVIAAYDGAQALELFERHQPGFVVLGAKRMAIVYGFDDGPHRVPSGAPRRSGARVVSAGKRAGPGER